MTNRFREGCAYIGDQYIPLAEAAIPITDWGFLRGDCVYDAVPFSKGRLFRLNDHLARLKESEEKWRLSCPLDHDQLRAVCHQCIALSELSDGLLMLITTRGLPPSLEVRNPALFTNRFYAFCQVLPPIAPKEKVAGGLNLVISKVPRVPEQCIDSSAKNFQWGDLMQARLEAHDNGVDNALLLDLEGNLTEGPGFNVFILKGTTLVTPLQHCLRGITRDTVMDIARSMDLIVEERAIGLEEMASADEIMLSTSAGGVMPVASVLDYWQASEASGETYARINLEYWRRREDPKYSEPVRIG